MRTRLRVLLGSLFLVRRRFDLRNDHSYFKPPDHIELWVSLSPTGSYCGMTAMRRSAGQVW